MYEDKLGRGWHNKVRSMIAVKKTLLTDTVIEDESNMKLATFAIFSSLGTDMMTSPPESPLNQDLYRKAFLHVLASVICADLATVTKKIPNVRDFHSLGEGLLQEGLALLRAIT